MAAVDWRAWGWNRNGGTKSWVTDRYPHNIQAVANDRAWGGELQVAAGPMDPRRGRPGRAVGFGAGCAAENGDKNDKRLHPLRVDVGGGGLDTRR